MFDNYPIKYTHLMNDETDIAFTHGTLSW